MKNNSSAIKASSYNFIGLHYTDACVYSRAAVGLHYDVPISLTLTHRTY